MDHWGDPWADDADTDTSANITAPAKVAHSPLRAPAYEAQTLTPAPIVLNGFLDDAGWGSNEWATTPSPRKEADVSHDIEGNEIEHAPSWDNHSVDEELDTPKYNREEEGPSAWSSGADDDLVPTIADGTANGQDNTSDHGSSHARSEETHLEDKDVQAENEWNAVDKEVMDSKAAEEDVSEASFSSTDTQLDDTPEDIPKHLVTSDHREDDASTRSSESPSEKSRNEAAAESPRTSVEEEHVDERPLELLEVEERDPEILDKNLVPQEPIEQEVEDEFGDFEDEVAKDEADTEPDTQSTPVQQNLSLKDIFEDASCDVQDSSAMASADLSSISSDSFVLDSKLIAELFPPAGETPELEEPSDDPVSSTSTRKAWYRLTRRQTMREYNYGAVDDNYIRVTWKTSHIRAEVNKTIMRWANEDRMAGRGPGARASFFWDSAAPPDKKAHEALHARNKSSRVLPKSVRPSREDLPPLSTELPAAFNWSSPTSTSHATPDSIERRSTSTPLSAKHNAVARLTRQGGRAASVDLSPRIKGPPSHRRTSTSTDFQERSMSPLRTPAITPTITPIQAPPSGTVDHWASPASSSPAGSISVPLPASTSEQIDPWANFEAIDSKAAPEQQNAEVEDDFDDWGEMVESPALSAVQTPVSAIETPLSTLHTAQTDSSATLLKDNSVTSAATTPVSATASPVQPLPLTAASTHASRIVRLQGTVSPTSALFKPNALVPTDSQERIGPHLLKKTNRSQEAASERMKQVTVPIPTMEEVLSQEPARESVDIVEEDKPSTAAISGPGTSRDSMSLQDSSQSTPITSGEAALPTSGDQSDWANDTDFSIFESAVPPSFTSTPRSSTPIATQSDPADPWSIFNSPVPSEKTMSPSTGVLNSADKRKIEEDEAVRRIVDGLPDLRYLLRR